jgi:hypothetical protein
MPQVCKDLQVLSTDTDGHPLDGDTMRTPIRKRGTRIEGCRYLIGKFHLYPFKVWGGLYHLKDVMKGKFGEVPTKSVK